MPTLESGQCRVCGSARLTSTVERPQLPAMQNYVYRDVAAAQAAKSGRFVLTQCGDCGFAQNNAFDPELLCYDQGYDNSVPSKVMADYYRDIAAYLGEKYGLSDGLLVDVGCGKGAFLQAASQMFPRMRGLGIDPSYEGPASVADGRIQFITEMFSCSQIHERPSLVICRHVLEHIFEPLSFLKSIHAALAAYPDVPVFVEVPDLQWILANDAYWDFCYEHCNYFAPASLKLAMAKAGFQPVNCQAGFGGQYLWIEARTLLAGAEGVVDNAGRGVAELCGAVTAYTQREYSLVVKMQRTLRRLKQEGQSVAVWGMATKGIMFSLMLDADRSLIDHCVDVNQNKQGCFVPVSGHAIEPPQSLQSAGAKPLTAIVMNPNYFTEIQKQCAAMSLAPRFMDANQRLLKAA